MSRIRKAYETRFHTLLRQAHARRRNQGVEWLMAKATAVSESRSAPLSEGLTQVYEALAGRPFFRRKQAALPVPERFFCDAGLGGLARWLRAAGYPAEWVEGIDDDDLLVQTIAVGATLLTTDSMLLERRLLRDGIIRSLWLPPTLKIPQQLELVFGEFRLAPKAPLCMACGGRLAPGSKEELRERIPPRTYLWLDEYFVCENCHQLFWHGTHWHRIQRTLGRLKDGGQLPGPDGGAS